MATGGLAPARLSIGDLLPDVLEGRIQPGKVLDRALSSTRSPTATGPSADRKPSRSSSNLDGFPRSTGSEGVQERE
jgi:hypothetical protein